MNSSHESRHSPDVREIKLIRVQSDFENQDGSHPEMEVDPEFGMFMLDIDGTLVNINPIHAEVVSKLYGKEFGITEVDLDYFFRNFGLGDYTEHSMLMDHHGVTFENEDEKDAKIREIMKEYGQAVENVLGELTDEQKETMLIPGGKEFLENLKRSHVPAIIVTGNVRQSAEAIIKNFGLAEYFVTGGYADDKGAEERSGILLSAVNRAKQKGLEFKPEKIVVLGDTPKDHAATLVNPETRGSITVLLSTGDHSLEQLDESGQGHEKDPDLVLPRMTLTIEDLSDDKILKRLLKQKPSG